VLLAWAGEHDRQRIVGSLPPNEARRLEREIATAIRRGWANSIGEREPGVASVSAPVFDAMGALVAAISVSGPAERIGAPRGRRFAPAVTEAAREIEATLGVAST
jgi:DNA-binding IclR family transcriptional regulator